MSAAIGADSRDRTLERLARGTFDVVVIGGGIVGAGVALEATARGLTVALLEREDFAAGASGRSSQLVHGGLRYLARLDVSLCRQAARERSVLLRLAPHMVRPQPFVYPALRGGRRRAVVTGGLAVYDRLAGLPRKARHRRLGTADVMALAPALRPDRVAGGHLFLEARTDDARLVLAVVRQAHRRGAVVVNHVGVRSVDAGGREVLLVGEDGRSGARVDVHARCVVNAAGAWASEVAGLVGAPRPPLRPSRGVHLVLPADRLPLGAACAVQAEDRREVFAVPLGGVVLVGTTDVEHLGSPDEPTVTPSEAAYLLDALNGAFATGLRATDVSAAWAGLRPLSGPDDRRTPDLPRRHHLAIGPARVVTITGGKLTTFRRMARDAVDAACEVLGRTCEPAPDIPLVGLDPMAERRIATRAVRLGLDPGTAEHLLGAHGDAAAGVLDLVAGDPSLGEALAPGLAPIRAEAVWAVRAELAVTLADVLDRRLRLALFDVAGGLASDAPALAARELGLTAVDQVADAAAYRSSLLRERGPFPVADVGPVVDRTAAPA